MELHFSLRRQLAWAMAFATLWISGLAFGQNNGLRCRPDGYCVIELPGLTCGDGTPSYYLFYNNPKATKLFIDLQGGGACWSNQTCFGLKTAETLTRLDPWKLNFAVNYTPDPTIYGSDYSTVFIPYCTGDVHIGDRTVNYGTNDKPQTIHHQGRRNMELIIDDLAQRLPATTELVFSGCSAGGIGMNWHLDQLAASFPGAKTTLLNVSGFPFKGPYVNAMNVEKILAGWGGTFPPGTVPGANGYFDGGDVMARNARVHGDTPYAFFSTYQDYLMTGFAALVGSPNPLTAVQHTLIDVARNELAGHDNHKVFYQRGSEHCSSFLSRTPQGTAYRDFLKKMIERSANWKNYIESPTAPATATPVNLTIPPKGTVPSR